MTLSLLQRLALFSRRRYKTVFAVAGLLATLLTMAWVARGCRARAELYMLLLLAVAGMMLLAVANDLVLAFLAIETFSISLYVLAGFQRDRREAQEAALKYFLLGAFAAGFLLYGTALVYASTGTTNLAAIQAYLEPRSTSLAARSDTAPRVSCSRHSASTSADTSAKLRCFGSVTASTSTQA